MNKLILILLMAGSSFAGIQKISKISVRDTIFTNTIQCSTDIIIGDRVSAGAHLLTLYKAAAPKLYMINNNTNDTAAAEILMGYQGESPAGRISIVNNENLNRFKIRTRSIAANSWIDAISIERSTGHIGIGTDSPGAYKLYSAHRGYIDSLYFGILMSVPDTSENAAHSDSADKAASAVLAPSYLPLAGGTMFGAIAMGAQEINNIGNTDFNNGSAMNFGGASVISNLLSLSMTGDIAMNANALTGGVSVLKNTPIVGSVGDTALVVHSAPDTIKVGFGLGGHIGIIYDDPDSAATPGGIIGLDVLANDAGDSVNVIGANINVSGGKNIIKGIVVNGLSMGANAVQTGININNFKTSIDADGDTGLVTPGIVKSMKNISDTIGVSHDAGVWAELQIKEGGNRDTLHWRRSDSLVSKLPGINPHSTLFSVTDSTYANATNNQWYRVNTDTCETYGGIIADCNSSFVTHSGKRHMHVILHAVLSLTGIGNDEVFECSFFRNQTEQIWSTYGKSVGSTQLDTDKIILLGSCILNPGDNLEVRERTTSGDNHAMTITHVTWMVVKVGE